MMKALRRPIDWIKRKMKHTHNFEFPRVGISVCARCSGLYGGFIFWLIIILASPFKFWIQVLSWYWIFIAFLISTFPLISDWWMQCLGIKHSTNIRRLLTGLLASTGVSIVLTGYCYLYITFPVVIVWLFIATRLGIYWRNQRSVDWGCRHCKKQAKIRKLILENSKKNGPYPLFRKDE